MDRNPCFDSCDLTPAPNPALFVVFVFCWLADGRRAGGLQLWTRWVDYGPHVIIAGCIALGVTSYAAHGFEDMHRRHRD